MKYTYDIVIIGAGSAGLVAASAAKSMGANVLLIENKKMGGDCLNYGCVPSKSFLKVAHFANKMKAVKQYGIQKVKVDINMSDVMNRVNNIVSEIAPHDSIERFENMGVEVVIGNAKFIDSHHLEIDGKTYSCKNIVIATGSRAYIPPIKGLQDITFETNETIFNLNKQPKHLIVLGAGPIGLEMGQGFAHLGSKVSVVDHSSTIFKKDDPKVSDIMKQILINDGVDLYLSFSVDEIKQVGQQIEVHIRNAKEQKVIIGDTLLVSTGRIPNIEGLEIDRIGLQTNERGYVIVDSYLRTNIKNIYACGDVHGLYQFTHTAGYEASVVVKNALIAPIFKTNYHNIAWITYTVPEVGHVGISKNNSKHAHLIKYEYTIDIRDNDRNKTDDDRVGFITVLLDYKKRVIGASMVSESTSDLLPILCLMVSQKMKVNTLLNMIYPYPTKASSLQNIALMNFKTSAKPWQKKLLRKVVTR